MKKNKSMTQSVYMQYTYCMGCETTAVCPADDQRWIQMHSIPIFIYIYNHHHVMAQPTGNEVDDAIRDLKAIPGFAAYAILNNDGIVIKYENMSYKTAVHHAHQVLSLSSKASRYIRDLFDVPDNEVESIRLRTSEYEMIIAQLGNFTVIVTQHPSKAEHVVVAEEKKEGEGEKKETV